jgi:hypothetical protein
LPWHGMAWKVWSLEFGSSHRYVSLPFWARVAKAFAGGHHYWAKIWLTDNRGVWFLSCLGVSHPPPSPPQWFFVQLTSVHTSPSLKNHPCNLFVCNNRPTFMWGFLKDDILACVETWD